MQSTWIPKAIKLGICASILFAGYKHTQPYYLRCSSLNPKLSLSWFNMSFREKISTLKSKLAISLNKPYAFESHHINLIVNDQKLYNTSFDFITRKDFDQLKFFNGVQEIWHELGEFKVIEGCERSIKNNIITYQFQYFTLDYKGNKTTTVIRLIGDTKINCYQFSIESEGKFTQMEREIVKKALALAGTFGVPYNSYETLTSISKAGWTVLEPYNNNFSLKDSFIKESLRTNIETIINLPNER